MTKVIYLVRHGQASFGQANYDELSLLGIEQSHRVGSALAQKPEETDTLFSGTLQRHRQTFEHACPSCPPPTALPEWNEFDHEAIFKAHMTRTNLSREAAMSFSDSERLAFFKAAVLNWVTQVDEPDNGEESWRAFRTRVQQGLLTTIEATDKASLVFTSGGPIASIVGELWQFSAEQILRLNQSLINTGITKLLVHAKGIDVVTINEHVHLEHAGKRLITYK
ncbi:histidine phosphatase family protein [Reinekea blandensis]|uniref:Putative phosphoglycerate mutase related protein n=1 Tax=Reinekea blandensis MED297 TaxID=314283 RepID=A4BGV6_9GAMM|nr:histidine phosphatase family protein [Reinekea blandensis]EAR08602.1 putative phosphoglycerate mutase related protein [Reinekea sp. MED297] [Reinekea blandensis MED297]